MNLNDTINNEGGVSPAGLKRKEGGGSTEAPLETNFDAFFGTTTMGGGDAEGVWDFGGGDLSIPTNFFENVSFMDEASNSSLTLSPKAMKSSDGESIPTRQEEEQPPAPLPAGGSTKKRRASSAGAPQVPQALPSLQQPSQAPQQRQNWFNLCQQGPPAAPTPYPPGMAYGPPTSPYLSGMATGGADWSGGSDPYSWMHSGRPKRGFTGAYHLPSPPMMYAPPGAFGALSPPFGMGPYGGHMIMPQPQMAVPKLPMQALPRVDYSASETANQGPMMAPLVLPTDLSRRFSGGSRDQPEIDPNAISNAISQALRTGAGPADGDSPTSSSASLSPLGIPAGASQGENMRLYESTFEAFVQEEAAIDYSNVTVIELKKLLRKYHLAATGRKDELIRLVKDVAQFLKGNPPKTDSEKEADGSSPLEKERKPSVEPNEEETKPSVAEKADHFTRFFEMS